MPNKRDNSKKQVAFWLSLQEREMLERAAQMHGMNMTDLVKTAIAKMLMESTDNGSQGNNASEGNTNAEGIRPDSGKGEGQRL